MTTETYRFVSDDDTDTDECADQVALLKHDETQRNQPADAKTMSTVDLQPHDNQTPAENNNGSLKESKVVIKKKKQKPKIHVKSVKDGVKQLEKHELVKKRQAILFQLAATAVIAMLHSLPMVPYFWNSILLNVLDLKTQTITLWCLFISYLFSCFLTPLIIQRLPMRWILCSGSVTVALFSSARFYPKLYLMVPASVLHGLTLAPFYTAVFSHIAKLAVQYEGYQGKPYKDTVVRFVACCTGILSCAPFLLSLFRVVILNLNKVSHPTQNPTSAECGFNYLWNWMDKVKAQNGLSPELYQVQAILGACLVCSLGSIVLIFVVLKDYQLPSHHMGDQPQEQVVASFEKLKDANHILLFPISLAVGMFETFCYTLYEQAFVACNFGPDNIFYIAVCISVAIMVITGPSAYFLPRVASMKVTVPAYIATLILLMITILGGYMHYAMFYVLAPLFGIVYYMLLTQVTAFILLQFMAKIEVSLSVFHLGRVTAFLLTFALVRYHGDNSTCTGAVLATLLIALICHVVLELRVRLLSQSEQCVGDSGGAYVLLEAQKAPWLPSVDPTTVDNTQVETMMTRLPSKEDDDKCNTQ